MNVTTCSKKLFVSLLYISLIAMPAYARLSTCILPDDAYYEFSFMFKPESFYGKNISLLNDCNGADKILWSRHTLDFTFDAVYGRETTGHNAIEFLAQGRNRGVWGNSRSISQTNYTPIKMSESVLGYHNHSIPRHIFWIREIWLKLNIEDVFGLSFRYPQTFTCGAFKFELGRGIALGPNYASGPEVLGFYSEDVIDQFAFGFKFSGNVTESCAYDLYGAILNNRSGSLSDTGAFVRGQLYDYQYCPQRGFGIVNFVIAGRLKWSPIDCPEIGKLTLEPYWMINDDPEQTVLVLGDAHSVLGSLGFAGEFETPRFACGFDSAINLGYQDVHGLDRNIVRIENIGKKITPDNTSQALLNEVNTQVVYNNPNDANDPQNGLPIPYIPNGTTQTVIENATRNAVWNGKSIGTVGQAGEWYGYLEAPIYLANSSGRFRDPYRNKYQGAMFVADAALISRDKNFQFAGTVGWASGDNNPNFDTIDGVYSGFIGLQELYYGKRVKSAFILGSSGKLRRPLSFPINSTVGNVASTVNGFTNIAFVGVGTTYKHNWACDKKVQLHTSIISYWQDFPSLAYDAEKRVELKTNADDFLGIEMNAFFDYYIMKDLKLFFVGAVFIPGEHFYEIKGKPINSAQLAALNRLDRTGFLGERVPNIGADTAITGNIGLEYYF